MEHMTEKQALQVALNALKVFLESAAYGIPVRFSTASRNLSEVEQALMDIDAK